MRSLEQIITDPANGNSPEFIAERLGLQPVLVRTQQEVARFKVDDLPVLGEYVPDGWTATTAAVWVPREMFYDDDEDELVLWGMAVAMTRLMTDRYGMPVKDAEFGIAVDSVGRESLSIRAYQRHRE